MEVVDVAEPDAAGPGELVVRPEVVGLCGSDFHYFHGDIGLTEDADELYPRIQGHEFSAIVEDVGPDCPPGFAAGQRVAVWPLSACGHCHCCRIGRENACENISLIGVHVDGALQELLRVPAHQAYPVAVDDPRLAAFIEPMSIAFHTVVRGRVEADEHVLVLGAGPIGQAVAIAALDRGAKVLLVDRIAGRLERCASGADLAVAGEGDDLEARAREWTGGELPEVVVEATGAKEPMRLALDLVAAAGRVVVVALSAHDVPLRVGILSHRELDVLGVSCCQGHEFAAAADLVARHRDAVAPLLTHDFSLEEAPQAIAFAIEHPDEVMKAVVHVP
ncbi:MAG: alcohol dehydrogenase catalytic domain-containing protein [Gaiellaceae bacterium]